MRGPRLTNPRTRGVAAALLVAAFALVVVLVDRSVGQSQTDDIDGRTWLVQQRADRSAVLLANGISGLIEAEAEQGGDAPLPLGLRFVSSVESHTLLASEEATVLVDNGHHSVRRFDGVDAATVSKHHLALIEQTEALLVPLDGGAHTEFDLPASPLQGARAVIDADGRTWVLAAVEDGDRKAMIIDPEDATVEQLDAPEGATDLILLDGGVAAISPERVSLLEGSTTFPGAGRAGVVPSVVVAADGVWATSNAGRLTVTGPDGNSTLLTAGPVAALAIWHGQVWGIDENGLLRVASGRLDRIPSVPSGAKPHVDGDRLWFVGEPTSLGGDAVVIDRHQNVTVFTLSNAELSLCVGGDCSAAQAAQFLEERLGSTTSTSSIPVEQRPPTPLSVPPAQPRFADDLQADTPTTTTAPEQAVNPEIVSEASTEQPTAGSPAEPTDTLPEEPAPTTEPPPAPRPPTSRPPETLPPETTLPPEPPIGLVLEAEPAPEGSAVHIRYGVLGTRQACEAGGSPTGTLVIDPGESVDALMVWEPDDSPQSRIESTTFLIEGPGSYTVGFAACGLSTSTAVVVTGPPVALIRATGLAEVGETITFSATVRPENWTISSHAWSGGLCGEGPSTSSEPTLSLVLSRPGAYCVALSVTIQPPEDAAPQEASATSSFEVPSTTTTEPPVDASTTTTTIAPPESTTTTVPPPSDSTSTTTTSTTGPPAPPPTG